MRRCKTLHFIRYPSTDGVKPIPKKWIFKIVFPIWGHGGEDAAPDLAQRRRHRLLHVRRRLRPRLAKSAREISRASTNSSEARWSNLDPRGP